MASNCLNFHLSDDIVNNIILNGKSPLQDNHLGDVVYRRTYSRIKSDGSNEEWKDTIKRCVEGSFHILKERIDDLNKPWNVNEGMNKASIMFDHFYNGYCLPPGRGLWCMGTDVIHKKHLNMALNNCSFISTEELNKDPARMFAILADMSMCGTGVGFDTEGANKVYIYQPEDVPIPPNQLELEDHTFYIQDSREGWVDSIEEHLNWYFKSNQIKKIFNYDNIRPQGVALKCFGGTSSGPDPLIELHNAIDKVFEREFAKQRDTLSSTGIVDICNLIGVCVVSGGVRRTALIAFGSNDDQEFRQLKDYEKNAYRLSFGWTSNNSIKAKMGQQYSDIEDSIQLNGEPGLAWLSNMQQYGRMCEPPNNVDRLVRGGNPCLEQSLHSYEVCCLVEVFPARCKDLNHFIEVLKTAFLYGKSVTLLETHIPETNEVIKRNRRIGCSLSGIAQFLGKYDIHTFKHWCEVGYQTIKKWDAIYSEWLNVPESIKCTSIKPSGTVSLLVGATPGVHYPNSRYYIRRVRMTKGLPLIEELINKGFHCEPCQMTPNSTMIISFPIDIGKCKTLDDVTMFHQLNLASFLQKYWADNQVSCTVTFRPEEKDYIADALDIYQYQLKGISFLPRSDGVYPQMPYEKLSKEQYLDELNKINERKNSLRSPNPKSQRREPAIDPDASNFCDGDTCQLNL